MQVVHLVEEGLADHPEVLDRLVVQLATLLRFAVARIDGAVERLLFLVERLHVVVVRIRVEVALVRETFGEEVIDDQEKFGVGRRVRLGVAASMVVGRAMAIVDEVEIDEEERTDVVHLGELERIVEVAICDQVRRDVSRLLLRRLEEMAIAAVRQTIALEDLVDRAKVHGAVGIVVEEIGVVEEIHRASRHQVMAIVDDPCLLVVGSGHRLVAVGFFAAFSRLPLKKLLAFIVKINLPSRRASSLRRSSSAASISSEITIKISIKNVKITLSTGFGFFLFSTNLFLSAFFEPFFASFSDSVLLSLLESDLSFSCKLCVKCFLFLFVKLSALSLKVC
jgi:hypothetical protein